MCRIGKNISIVKYRMFLILAALGLTACTSPEVSEIKKNATWDQASCNELASASGLYLMGVGEFIAKSDAAREKGETEIADKQSAGALSLSEIATNHAETFVAYCSETEVWKEDDCKNVSNASQFFTKLSYDFIQKSDAAGKEGDLKAEYEYGAATVYASKLAANYATHSRAYCN